MELRLHFTGTALDRNAWSRFTSSSMNNGLFMYVSNLSYKISRTFECPA
jgi:hypothetical protein